MEPEVDDAVGMVASGASVCDDPGGGVVGFGSIVEDGLDMVIGAE